MNYQEKEIAAKLQKIPENKLTREIIIPLFNKLGYQKVEFYGGPAEEGKDIVLWYKDELEEIKLKVAQVKHFKFTNKASDSKSLQTVVNQLTNCFSKSLIYTDKTVYFPSEALLITTFEIDTKALQSRFNSFPNLKDQQIRIIDGIKLAELLIKHKPDIVKNLIGITFEIVAKLRPKLNNRILLAALGTRREKDILTIYTDIDFSLGKISTKLFFNSTFKPIKQKIELKKDDWELFKKLCNEISKEFTLNFLVQSIDQIDESNKEALSEYNRWKEKYSLLDTQVKSDKRVLDDLQKERNDQIKKMDELKKTNENKGRVVDFENQNNREEKLMGEILEKIDKINESIFYKTKKLRTLKDNELKISYKIEFDGTFLVNEIKAKRQWIENKVIEFNNKIPNSNELKKFIQKCNSIIDTVSIVLVERTPNIFGCIGCDSSKVFRDDFETTRFKLSIDQVFDTGLNITVLGEAGAGKTTSVEMYAHSREDTTKIVILAPLGYVIQNGIKSSAKYIEASDKNNLEEWIAKYLEYMGIQITLSEFRYILEKENVVLLLDGLDEAIKLAPWLPDGIRNLAEKYKGKIQIIVTSRMYGTYLDEIPFFTITLLPFTLEQRDNFIDKWFKKEEDDGLIVQKIKNHLIENKAISDIIRNPLLTTTLCVLAEHNLPLPKTEIKLYDERIKLFTGYYDNVKHIITRITSTPNTLEKLAQKLAFYLHSNNRREDFKEVLEKHAIKLISNQIGKQNAITAFNEIIDPCELLIPMSPDGKYGFGHLRYQEHLAALELFNRSIDLKPLLKQPWWASVLILFARMNDDLEWFLHSIGKQRLISMSIVQEMIKARPKSEQVNLESLFEKYEILDNDNIPYLTLKNEDDLDLEADDYFRHDFDH